MSKQSSMTVLPVAVFFLVVVQKLALVAAVTHQYHDYIIIGAGPSGLQMGYYLKSDNRDYVILERGNVSGSFFTKFPRHDRLISINKRHTGKTNKEFNLRHDWNSLISDDESLQFKYYSKEYFPDRKEMIRYLNDFEHKLGLKVLHNIEAKNIHRLSENNKTERGQSTQAQFVLNDQHGNVYECKTLFIATGLWKPYKPEFQGSEYVEGYEDVSVDPDDFEGQTVLILGRGNSAFEIADRIFGATNLVHMIGRSRVRLSWATHYVGDLRAVNNNLLDNYQLKSLDGVLEAPMEELKLVKHGEKLYLDFSGIGGNESEMFDNFAMREPYDRVIMALGFEFDDSLFSNDTKISRGEHRSSKFPVIDHDYQSKDVPGMYYIGTVTHSLDFRKSSGGFIHGFRYTTRALHHLLEWKNHQSPWPATTGPISQLMPTILKRLNEASGPYQMFTVLGDIYLFKNNHKEFELLEEYPVELLHELPQRTGHDVKDLIVFLLEYGPNFSGPGKDIFRLDRATGEPSEAHESNFLHPVFYYYKMLPTYADMQYRHPRQKLPKPNSMHHVVEDFLTSWDAPASHILPLRRFLEDILKQDLRYFTSESCFQMSLLHQTPPHMCDEHFLSGQGLLHNDDLLDSITENVIDVEQSHQKTIMH